MSETTIIKTDSESEPTAETASTERAVGRLEAETEQIAEQAQEATETAETAQQTSEAAITIAFNAETEISNLRSEMNQKFEEVTNLILATAESEDEEDQEEAEEADEAAILDDSPAETETIPTADEAPDPKKRHWLMRILGGK